MSSKPTHVLVFVHDRPYAEERIKALRASHPGPLTTSMAESLPEFKRLAKAEKDRVSWVILPPTATEEEVEKAKEIVRDVWGRVKASKDEKGEGMWVLRLPPTMKYKVDEIDQVMREQV